MTARTGNSNGNCSGSSSDDDNSNGKTGRALANGGHGGAEEKFQVAGGFGVLLDGSLDGFLRVGAVGFRGEHGGELVRTRVFGRAPVGFPPRCGGGCTGRLAVFVYVSGARLPRLCA